MKPRARTVLLVCIPIFMLSFGAWYMYYLWYHRIDKVSIIITNKTLNFTVKKYHHIIVENLLWDTGCEKSVFFKKTANEKKRIGFFSVNDNPNRDTLYYSDSVVFPFGIAVNFIYPVIDIDNKSAFIKALNLTGVIGMNIIRSANWLIDFSQNIIYVDTLFLPDVQPKISVSYKNRLWPIACIYIEDIKIDNVLVDAGSDSDLCLLESEIQNINSKIIPYDTCTKIYFQMYSKEKQQVYAYKNIRINEYNIDTLHIHQISAQSRIGIGFFRKFEKVYLDTKEQVFKFY